MKKSNIYLLIIFFSLAHTSFSQERIRHGFFADLKSAKQLKTNAGVQSKPSASYAPGRSVNYSWNSSSTNWIFNDTTIYTYNSQGLSSEIIIRNGTPYYRNLLTYDSKARLTQTLKQTWDFSTNFWKNYNREITIYDQNDNQIEYRYENYNTLTNQWEFSGGGKNIITYNANIWILSNVEQNYNSILAIWEDDSRILNLTFHGNGFPTKSEYQNKTGNTWQNYARITDAYSIFNELVEETIEIWNGSAYIKDSRFTNVTWHNWTGDPNTNAIGSYTSQVWGSPNANQWNTYARHTSTYDNYGGSIGTDQEYINSIWVNDYRYTDFYDLYFNYTGNRYENWNTGTNSWNISGEQKLVHFYGFNGSTNITKTVWQNWNSSSMAFENSEMKEYSDFKLISGIRSNGDLSTSQISIFPNPFSTSCILRLENSVQNSENNLSIYLYDLFGKVVYQSKLRGQETQIEKGNLTQGIYFYSVMDENSVLTKGKLIVE